MLFVPLFTAKFVTPAESVAVAQAAPIPKTPFTLVVVVVIPLVAS